MRTPGHKEPQADENFEPESSAYSLANYKSLLEDLTPPVRADERVEWVRQSYQRFFDKVVEIETLMGRPFVEIG